MCSNKKNGPTRSHREAVRGPLGIGDVIRDLHRFENARMHGLAG